MNGIPPSIGPYLVAQDPQEIVKKTGALVQKLQETTGKDPRKELHKEILAQADAFELMLAAKLAALQDRSPDKK